MNKLYFIYLILIITLFNFCFSLKQSEYDCLNGIITNTNMNITYLNMTDGNYDFCAENHNFICGNFSSVMQLTSLTLIQTNNFQIDPTSFDCFEKLYQLEVQSGKFQVGFVSNIKAPKLILDSCSGIYPINSPINQEDISYKNVVEFNGDIKFSLFGYNLYTFNMYSENPNDLIITYTNDLADSTKLYLSQAGIISQNIPSMKNVIVDYDFSINLNRNYNLQYKSTRSNLSTFKNVKELSLGNTDAFLFDFPFELFNIENSTMNKLSLYIDITPPTSKINIPMIKSNQIRELYLSQTKDFFVNNTLPFNSLGNLNSLIVDGGNLSNGVNFSLFSKLENLEITNGNLAQNLPVFTNNILRSLDLSNNKLTGTIDKSYCTIQWINLSGNSLTGLAPSCMLCNLATNSFTLDYAQVGPFNYNCTTFKANIYQDTVNKKLIVYGQDLGINFLYTTPMFDWQFVVPSYRIEASYDKFFFPLPADGIVTIYYGNGSPKSLKVKISQTEQPPACFRDCTIGEYCDQVSHRCLCKPGWTGSDCSINTNLNHTVSSSIQNGDIVTLNGWFTNQHQDLSITIDGANCPVILSSISNTSIQCTISTKGSGSVPIVVTQNSLLWSGNFIYEIPPILNCYKDCSSNGVCNTTTGTCLCNTGYKGFDCSTSNNGPTSNTTIDDNGTTTIKNQKTSYEILINKLVEFDFNKNVVNEYSLNNNWIVTNRYSDSTENSSLEEINNQPLEFSQTLVQSLTNCTISYTIEEIKDQPKQFSFAGYDMSLDVGSIKISVSIYNYQYQSFLNTLQLQFQSSVSSANNADDDDDCNKQDTNIDKGNSNNQFELLNYISIKKDSKILQARFLNKILSDGKSTLITSEVVSNTADSITIGLNLPHCQDVCTIDPDFSVLVSPDFQSSCDNDHTGRPAYLLPVIIVSCVVGVSVLVGLSYLVYRKRFVENQLSKKLKTLNKK